MEVKHPRRILIASAPNTDVLSVVKELTGSIPSLDTSGSVAGATHVWPIQTNYYSADVPIWLDEIADVTAWKEEFLKPEAKEVVHAVGGWVYCFARPKGNGRDAAKDIESAMEAIEAIINKACGYAWEGTKLAIATSGGSTVSEQGIEQVEEWEDRCMQYGFEYVDAAATGKNEFGEAVGIARAKESLETNDWSSSALDDASGSDEEFGSFDNEEAQMNAELWGLKASLLNPETDSDAALDGDEATQVEDLQHLMAQALAIKDSAAELPLEERKTFAARAVSDMMKKR